MIACGSIRLRRAAHDYFRYRQMRIAAEMAALDLNVNLRPVAGHVRDRLWSRLRAPCAIETMASMPQRTGVNFIGCECTQGRMRPRRIVPIPEFIQSSLDMTCGKAKQYQPAPELHRSEQPLDLSVQKWRSYTGSYMPEFLLSHGFAEELSELAAIVGDEELWLSMFDGCAAHHRREVVGARRTGINLHRQQFPRKPIHDSRDEEREPQDADLRHVAMPDAASLRESRAGERWISRA